MHIPDWQWLRNPAIFAGVGAWVFTQCVKLLCNFAETRKIDFSYLVRLGGMPSSHSAAVCALATSVGLMAGFDTPVFATSLGLALVVMFDAQTVRRSAGLQARILNQIIEHLVKERRFPEHKLAELFGHTRLEVFLGGMIGILLALLVHGWLGCPA